MPNQHEKIEVPMDLSTLNPDSTEASASGLQAGASRSPEAGTSTNSSSLHVVRTINHDEFVEEEVRTAQRGVQAVPPVIRDPRLRRTNVDEFLNQFRMGGIATPEIK